jgi:hypothetical protein
MNWAVFTIVTYVLLVLQVGLRNLFEVSLLGVDDVLPSLPLVLLVFIGMGGGRGVTLWAAMILGLLMDLQGAVVTTSTGDVSVAIVGPHVIGYVAAAYVVLEARVLIFRNSPLTMGVLTFISGLAAQLIVVALLSLRQIDVIPGEPVAGWDAADELLKAFFALLYTVLFAVLLNIPMRMTLPMWGFDSGKRTRRTSPGR